MADRYITQNLASVILTRSRPGITLWNRLEGRPRTESFDRALQAPVRDALWMLTRQWQMGEFIGDDAGSPIEAKVCVATTRLRKYRSVHGGVEPFDDTIPLEAHVERRPIPFLQIADPDEPPHEISLDLRLMMGRHWLKMLRSVAPGPVVAAEFVAAYSVHIPDPANPNDAPTCAHVEAWSNFAAANGRLMDGAKLYAHLTGSATHHASDGIASLAGMDAVVDPVAERFVAWFQRLLYQPDGADAWEDDRFEYQFAVSAPRSVGADEQVLTAEEYFNGHLDWYGFDADLTQTLLGPPIGGDDARETVTLTMLPTQATFNGMPNTRWWRFEDSRTNFGDVRPDTTDLAKLLLIEFGLVYANDWLLVPFTLDAGTIADIRGIAVTNVFGERTWVQAAGSGLDDDWQRWAMFLLATKGEAGEAADLSLMVPPAAQQVLEGRPLEEVLFARDEMANMVWAVERVISLPSGEPTFGQTAADEIRSFFERRREAELGATPEPLPPAPGAKVRYEVMGTVPENWIPMVPMHVANDNRQVQLRRASMLRILVGDTELDSDRVRPRTTLLRPGLDTLPQTGWSIHEEEVPRSGIRVTQQFQRTRWRDGRAWVWLGVRKQTGRGEGSSGLSFDRLVDLPPPT